MSNDAKLTREKIESLRGYPLTVEENYSLCDLALSALERKGWIPVSERLPESGVDVLFITSTGSWLGKRWNEWNGWLDHFDNEPICDDKDVTHWMPIPAAPKEDK